jgi:hypothetical protein
MLRNVGPVYASNIAYKSLTVDNLVTVDNGILQQVIDSGYQCNMYTTALNAQNKSDIPYVRALPDIPYKGKRRYDRPDYWSSEAYALLLSAVQESDIVFMVGYDIWDNMQTSNANVYQIAKIFEHYPNTQFIQIQDTAWDIPPSWEPYENFLMDEYDTMYSYVESESQ